MNIEEHFNIILNEYKLKSLYKKFILLTVITVFIIRGFYWILIIFSDIIQTKPELIKTYSIILILLFSLNTPLQKILKDVTTKFIKEIKVANTKYFNDKIKNINKCDLLNFNLTEYYITLTNFNDNLEQYILNKKNEYEIPFYYITLIIIAISKKDGLMITLFAIFYIVIKTLNEIKLSNELPLIKDCFTFDNNIRNYITNGKIFLINNEINNEYLLDNIDNLEESKLKLNKLNNLLDNRANIAMILFVIIIISYKIKNLNKYDFFYYFLIVYDIEYVADKMAEYYKNKVINKMQERLNFLNDIKCNTVIINDKSPINKIIINEIKNNKPRIEITSPIIIEPNDHILINGNSGSGKTSLLYILKGILIPDTLMIEPNINDINNQSYITLPNNKNLFNDYLYNIITNYESKPNIEMINFALEQSKINHKLNDNIYINIEKLSSGERVRLYIAQVIYIVKTKNYNILLFDELDENLNDEIAQEICNNIKEIFKDKIILYISHNMSINNLFKKKIIVKDGVISNIILQ